MGLCGRRCCRYRRIRCWKIYKEGFDDNYHISYQQIDGDLKKFAGKWILTPIPEGAEVKLTVDFEFGIPMIAGLLNPILKNKVRLNSENMLKAIKAQVEKSL